MENKVRKHVDNLFKTFKQDEKTLDIKEELISNLLERIDDSIASGMKEKVAFDKAIGNLGSTSEIRKIFNFKSITDYDFEYKMSSIATMIAVVLYLIIGFVFELWHPGWVIFIIALGVSNVKLNDKKSYVIPVISFVYVFIGFMWDYWHPGWIIFPIGFIMFATMNKKYGALWLMTGTVYVILGVLFGNWILFTLIFLVAAALVAGRDQFVAGLWLFTIAGYLFIGLAFDLWHPGWIVFGIAVAITVIITEKSIEGFTWIAAITSFLFVGLTFDLWHPTWVVFLVAAAVSAYLDEDKGTNIIEIKKIENISSDKEEL